MHYSCCDSTSFVKINTVNTFQGQKAYWEFWFQIPAPTPTFSLWHPLLPWLILFLTMKHSAHLPCIRVLLESLVKNSPTPSLTLPLPACPAVPGFWFAALYWSTVKRKGEKMNAHRTCDLFILVLLPRIFVSPYNSNLPNDPMHSCSWFPLDHLPYFCH